MSFIDEELAKHEPQWEKAYSYFPKVLRDQNSKVGVEIGVAFGGHSEAILKSTKIEKLYAVDPYRHMDGYDDPLNYSQEDFDALYEMVKKRLKPYKKRAQILRMTSEEAAGEIEEYLDFVYIDGDHSYYGVSNDLRLWHPKIKVGGIIGGHDYGHPQHAGVQKAVDRWLQKNDLKLNVEGEGVWWVINTGMKTADSRLWRWYEKIWS